MQEHRLTTRLIAMWDMLSKEGSLPDYAQFNHARVDDLWENCLVVAPMPRSEQAKLIFQLKHLGNKLNAVLGNPIIGSYIISQAKSFAGAKIMNRVSEVMDIPKPLEEEGQFVNDRSKIVKYRSCMLPFGNSQQEVTHVLIGVSWREF